MAPASYSTSTDIESLVFSHRPAAARPWAAALAGAAGFATALLVGLAFSAAVTPTTQAVQVQPTVSQQSAVAPAPHRAGAPSLLQKAGQGLVAVSLTAMTQLGTPYISQAAELDLLSTPTPTTEYIFDDGAMLSKAATGELAAQLPEIEAKTGYRINVVTLRKLGASEDAFQFADNLIETWYPTAELGDKKAVLVIVKGSKEGALVGGPSFSQAVPSSIVESIVNDNLGKLAAEEKFNQAIQSTVKRVGAVLAGQPDPGAPKSLYAKDAAPQSQTYKTKEETDSKRGVYTAVFGALVAISFIAPMVQFFGYTKDE